MTTWRKPMRSTRRWKSAPSNGIAIAEQVGAAGLVRERVGDQLSYPGGGGLVDDADVNEFSTVVASHNRRLSP